MDIISTQKLVRISPKKLRPVADVARKMKPTESLEKLPFLQKRGSEVLLKVIKSALENAKQKGVSDSEIVFKEIQIQEGPRLKRGRAASRGRWHPYKRRMSHIRVVLTTHKENVDKQTSKGEVKDEEKSGGEVKDQKDLGTKQSKSKKTVSKQVGSVGKVLKAVVSRKGGTRG